MTVLYFRTNPSSPNALPDPLVPVITPDGQGRIMPRPMTVGGILAGLSRRFPNQPSGPLTPRLSQASDATFVDGGIAYAFFTSPALDPHAPIPDPNEFDREYTEMGILAQAPNHCIYSPSPIAYLNVMSGIYPAGYEYSNSRALAKQQAATYMGMGLIDSSHRVLDIGCDFGFFIKALKKAGVSDVWGVEPRKADQLEELQTHHRNKNNKPFSPRTREMIDAVVDSTVEDYLLRADFQPFDVATINNFNASASSTDEMFEALARAIKPDGKAIVGVCGCDPHLAKPESPAYLGNDLSQRFQQVRFVKAVDTEMGRDTGSVGAQLGFFVCSGPILPPPRPSKSRMRQLASFSNPLTRPIAKIASTFARRRDTGSGAA